MPDTPNMTKTIVTEGQIRITQNVAERIVTIQMPDGQMVVLSGDGSVSITDSNANNITMSSGGIAITSQTDLTIKARGSISIEGGAGVNIASSGSIKAEALQISAEASTKLELMGTASADLRSSGQVTVQGAMVMIN